MEKIEERSFDDFDDVLPWNLTIEALNRETLFAYVHIACNFILLLNDTIARV